MLRSVSVLRSAFGAPGLALAAAAYGVSALVALVLWTALQMPALGARFVPRDGEIMVIAAGETEIASLSPTAMVTISGEAVVVSGPAASFVQDFVPNSAHTDLATWFSDRTRLGTLSGAPARLALPNQPPVAIGPVSGRTLADLSADVWMLMAGGGGVLLLGVWVCSLRPRDWGAQMFLLASAGIGLSAFSGAVYDARELTADGRLLWTMITLNYVGASLGLGATVAQFALFPRRLVPTALVLPLVLAELGWGVAGGVGWLSSGVFYAGLLAHLPLLAAMLAVQWRKARAAPGDRAILRWIGATTGIGAGVLIAGMAAPQLSAIPPLASDGFAFVPLLAVYGGMALAVGRLKVFDLDRWAYRLVVMALVTLLFLAIDAALALALHLAEPLAFSLAMVAVAVAYLPLRAVLWRRVMGGPRMDQATLFERAAGVAFQAEPEQRRADWSRLLQDVFDPLEISLSDRDLSTPQFTADRFELHIPAAAAQQALSLRLPHRGRRLFNASDLGLARQLADLMARAEQARDSHAQGVREERARIARDLHDDVGARLLTSLHRQGLGEIREDVRQAMGDIRLIFNGLSGDMPDLSQLLADLRHETSERLSAAGVEMEWPVPRHEPPPRLLRYDVYKTLVSAVRETITNSLKHAEANRVVVTVATLGDVLRVEIQDDGRGVSGGAGGGKGLRNTYDRLAAVGGTFTFTPTDDGCLSVLVIPLGAAAPPIPGEDGATQAP